MAVAKVADILGLSSPSGLDLLRRWVPVGEVVELPSVLVDLAECHPDEFVPHFLCRDRERHRPRHEAVGELGRRPADGPCPRANGLIASGQNLWMKTHAVVQSSPNHTPAMVIIRRASAYPERGSDRGSSKGAGNTGER